MLQFLTRGSRKQELDLTISARTFAKVVLLVVVTMLLLTIVERTTFVLTLIVVALFFAFVLNAPVTWLARHLPGKLRNSRAFATGISFLIVLSILGIFLTSIVPPTIRQTQAFVANAPATLQQLRRQYHDVDQIVVRYHLQGQVDDLTNELTSRLRSTTSSAFTAVTSVLTSLFSLITVLVLTIMMLTEGPHWINFADSVVPPSRRQHFTHLRTEMFKVIQGYVNGQVTLAVIASILVLPGLLIFHVSYPFALMALVFICGMVPMVGHTIGAIIVTIIALFHSPYSALGILVYYILYQQVETYLIQPRLQANTTNLSPLLIFIALLVGAGFGGLVGGLVAIPLAACMRVVIVDYLNSRDDLQEDLVPAKA